MELAALPCWEIGIYWFLSVASHLYSFYQLHLFSKEHEQNMDQDLQLEKSFFIWSLRKDPTDFEWSFWTEWACRSLIWSLIGHAVVSQLCRVYVPQGRKVVLMAYGVLCAWWLLGSKGVAVLLLHLVASLAVAHLRSPALCWGHTLLLLSTLHIGALQDIQRAWYRTDEHYYLLLFSTAMCALRCTSFSLELCWSPAPGGVTAAREFLPRLYDLVSYCFYHPLFYNGPIVTYDRFSQQVERAVCETSAACVCAQVVRVCVWWCLAELMIHLMYLHTLQNHERLLELLPPWALGGLALALVQFFYVKYLVLFGVAALLVKLDGIEPPALPRCVSIMYSFQGMWRFFDVGLYTWLLRYLYVPLGGSRRGLLLRLVSTALAFVFVAFWHGFHDYLQCWALMNWVCVVLEKGVASFLRWPRLYRATVRYLSPATRRRCLALISSLSTAMLILSNLVFLGGIQIGLVYWRRVFVQGWSTVTLPMLGFLYCFAQVGMEVDRKTT